MENLKFDKEIAALLVIDPYNDFISEGGKLWDRLKTVAEAAIGVYLALTIAPQPGREWTSCNTEWQGWRHREQNVRMLRATDKEKEK